MIDGQVGFICIDDDGEPLVAMHWVHRFNHMVGRYNSIFKLQMPNILHTFAGIPIAVTKQSRV